MNLLEQLLFEEANACEIFDMHEITGYKDKETSRDTSAQRKKPKESSTSASR